MASVRNACFTCGNGPEGVTCADCVARYGAPVGSSDCPVWVLAKELHRLRAMVNGLAATVRRLEQGK